MLSNTLKDYKENYEGRLSAHKKEYFENDKTSFLELELSNYTKYYNSLKKVSPFIKASPKNNLGHYPITSEVGRELKIINKPVFDEIISETKADQEYDEDEFRRLLYPGKNAPSIEIDIKVLNNRITSAKRILGFINKKLTNPPSSIIPENKTNFKDDSTDGNLKNKVNWHPQVFLNPKAFELFEKLHETYITQKTPLAYYSFIYRKMYDDGYIHESFKTAMFKNWLSEHYEIALDKIKTIQKCSTDSKIQTYDMAKKLLKIKPSSFYKKEQKRS